MRSTGFQLPDFLPYQLSVLSARINKSLARIYGDQYGLSMAEWRVMVHVAQSEKASVREIRDSVNLEKPAVSRAVAKLEKSALLAKTTSPRDHRLVEIELTDAGFDVLNSIIPDALALQKALLSRFSEAEKRQFSDLMARLHVELDRQSSSSGGADAPDT